MGAAAATAFDQVGLRAVLGVVLLDFPTPYASDADDYLRKGLAARDQWRDHPRIGFAVAPHAPYTVSDEGLRRALALADELDLPIHIHIHETAHEITASIAAHGLRPVARLARLGLLGANLIGVHAVHLDQADLDLLARLGKGAFACVFLARQRSMQRLVALKVSANRGNEPQTRPLISMRRGPRSPTLNSTIARPVHSSAARRRHA